MNGAAALAIPQGYLTADLPGSGGVSKATPEDFRVIEIPLYRPCGEGEHTYLTVEKRGITTLEAVRRLARACRVAEREIGYAGMKDARAVTEQLFSLPRLDPAQALALEIPGLRVLAAVRHGNKLRLGHLAGNRFRIRLRDVDPAGEERARAVLAVLAERGVPNRFGPQRYGLQGNSHRIGRALLAGDGEAAVRLLLGEPAAVSDERWREAILAAQGGDHAAALQLYPPFCRTEREVLQRLLKRPDDWQGALRAVPPRLFKLYLSALQSLLFDQVLMARLPHLDRLLPGDLAYKHANGACFLVTDAAAEAPRAATMEISPSGPLFGSQTLHPEGEPLQVEEGVLAAAGLCRADFAQAGSLALPGERRPLRVPLGDVELMADAEGLQLAFSLPKGSYATSVLAEVMKTPAANQADG